MSHADPVVIFLDELERLLDALYIVGLNGLESAHRSDMARLQVEAGQLGLDSAARLLGRFQEASDYALVWPRLQALRIWATRFHQRYSLATLNLTPSSQIGLKKPVAVEIVPFLEVAVLGAYPLPTGRVLLYCYELRQAKVLIIEDVAAPLPRWNIVQSLLFNENELDYLEILEHRLYFRGLQKGKAAKGEERLLPALGASYHELEPVDRLALWSEAQTNGPLRARSIEEAIQFCSPTPNAIKVLDKRAEEGYTPWLLLAPNPAPRPRRETPDWRPYIAIAATFRPSDPAQPALYSLINLAEPD